MRSKIESPSSTAMEAKISKDPEVGSNAEGTTNTSPQPSNSLLREDDADPQTSAAGSPEPKGASTQTRKSRRALRACLACRLRKVRCDVVERSPCGNCRWGNVECIVMKRPRGRIRRSKNTAAATESEPTTRPNAVASLRRDIRDEATKSPEPQVAPFLSQNLIHHHGLIPLPGFIKPVEARLASDDVAFLHSKGALSLPSLKFQNALLLSFFEFIYPCLPIVNIDQFLRCVGKRDGSAGQVSLLLFQAILFAGVSHVDMECIWEAGFRTRKQARKAFFQRALLLYDFNCETDRLTLVQVALLMTLWYGAPDEHRNAWYWVDVAISQAFAAGLHRDPCFAMPLARPAEQRLRRRIWWSCFVRDKHISLAMRRPPRVRAGDSSVAMLDEFDFHLERISEDDLDVPLKSMCSYIYDEQKQSVLAKLCVAMASLCRCMKPYLRAYSSLFSENRGDDGADNCFLPKNDEEYAFASCNRDLLTWYNSLPDCCRPSRLTPAEVDREDKASVALNRTMLHMLYYAALCNLHRARFASLIRNPDAPLLEQEISRACMQDAAKQISSMANDINNLNLGRYLPTMGVTVAIAAAAIHLDEAKGRIQADREAAYRGYHRCRKLMESLEDIYTSAKVAKDALEMEWDFIESHEQSYWRKAADMTSGGSETLASVPSLLGSRSISEDATTPDRHAEGSLDGVGMSRFGDETDKDACMHGHGGLPTVDGQVGGTEGWVDLLLGDALDGFADLIAMPGTTQAR